MRIALIAMSGVRACDPELTAMGLSLPGFVERGKIIASLPSLGLLTLAGMTPGEHRVRYLEVEELNGRAELPVDVDLVGISSYTAQIEQAYALADRYRALDIPVVLGGPHVTALPDEASRHADAVVVAEGEASWPALLDDAASGRLKGRYGARNGGFDLAKAPLPAFELLDIDRYNRLTVQTSRGCPHLCEFCASSVLLSSRYKQKPVGKVLAEIDRILSLWAHPFVEFADDNALVNRRYWKELLGQLRKRRIKWFAETDLSIYEDEKLLHLMRESGCSQVLVGFESPTPDALAGIELHNDWKHRRFPEYRDAIRRMQGAGISVNGCFVVGLDGHGPEVFDEILEFVRATDLFEVQITIPTPFPGTPFYERLQQEGRLLEDGRWEACTLFDVNFEPSGMTVDELRSGFKRLARVLYGETETRRRRDAFKRNLKRLALDRKGVPV
jgi:radical SAM superfamily enzyme YgiQ (UPF0313 family)